MVKDLNTNEIKDRTGAEVEFTQISLGERESKYKSVLETPAYPNRLSIKHSETGSGSATRRRSLVRFDRSVQGQVDTTKPASISCYMVLDYPVGNITTVTTVQDVVAYLMSFVASLGATTTILYDGTGNGARALLNGEI
jgi:hypothetical protein